ncbi:MAG TPA: UDP-3-O-(3-hydroxymyristoyl)glucosamine N-acyltransferase [Bryobacteraceae bacterium]|nr:UDP-3-O-(3-hydroxymyristoyl)glucosamine N-acyltransferase [Bryobacteraceae bacterium]
MGIPLYHTGVKENAVRVRELADLLGCTFEGDGEKDITGAAPLEAAGCADISFVGNRKAAEQSHVSAAGCLVVPPDFPGGGRALIRAAQPRAAFAAIVAHLYPRPAIVPSIHGTAMIADGAAVDPSCSVGAHASIGQDTRIGAGTSIGPGCSIGSRVLIGENCVLHANVTLYDEVELGRGCILHSGSVLGADGFGFILAGDHYEKFPQVGRVVLGDAVEVGANSCIDRAALGVTSIGDGAKLDNMVHIGHNCRIGKHVVIAAQTGLSGGVVVGDYAVIGGQVGIGDKARIEARAVLGSGSGVLTSKIVHAGHVMWGTPARPLRDHLEQLANIHRIGDMRKEVTELRRRLAALETK